MNQKFQLIPISSVQVLHDYVHWRCSVDYCVKGILSDSNTIFLWHESEGINKKTLFPKFQLIPILRFQGMHDYVCSIAPIDYCVE